MPNVHGSQYHRFDVRFSLPADVLETWKRATPRKEWRVCLYAHAITQWQSYNIRAAHLQTFSVIRVNGRHITAPPHGHKVGG